MYAVIETGGKQYRVKPGDIVQIEKLEGDIGSPVQFEQVLFCSNPEKGESEIWLGRPYIDNAKVGAQILGQGRGDKVIVFKFKRRKGYKRTQGHRQFYTQVLITEVDNGAGTKDALSAKDKESTIAKFRSQLTPRGTAFTPKTLGSRIKLKGGPDEAKKAPSKGKKTAKKAAPARKKKKKAAGKKRAKKKAAKKS